MNRRVNGVNTSVCAESELGL